MFDVKDKIFLVTGAAAGIGEGVARALAEKGAKHIAILDIDVKNGNALEAEINCKYGSNVAKFHKCDVTTAELDAAFDATIKQFGYIDVVINNAGIMNDGPDFYLKALEVNVTSLIRSSLKAYNLMRKDNGGKGGTIVNISSIVGLMQSSLLPVYSAAKSAVLQFSNCLGAEQTFNRTGVRVITLCFGTTDTNLINGYVGAIDDVIENIIPQALSRMPKQGVDDAVKGMLVAIENGESGDTWLITSGKPAENITRTVKDSYANLSKTFME
ncbi:15-hydroxyprostaglandin dehydrogenase [NAD(+)] [Pieris rapae]|uniref:15-hydroxyprostaglandin dehydrogenase [NAD(+)] n=1 Tax=Pieris rapae TaxID=64459 RepID=UPI000B9285E6|nr:15-hydroxyprostaglandin dehydrogenase [NAD(+)] [Pieris rapae]